MVQEACAACLVLRYRHDGQIERGRRTKDESANSTKRGTNDPLPPPPPRPNAMRSMCTPPKKYLMPWRTPCIFDKHTGGRACEVYIVRGPPPPASTRTPGGVAYKTGSNAMCFVMLPPPLLSLRRSLSHEEMGKLVCSISSMSRKSCRLSTVLPSLPFWYNPRSSLRYNPKNKEYILSTQTWAACRRDH